MLDQALKWQIYKISPNEESIYVINSRNGTIRQFSVPAAEDAWMVGNLLIIRCTSGRWNPIVAQDAGFMANSRFFK